ncbi:hypothetical protein [Chitinophaga sp. HK235]|uniref:hypothetical protein n=1 Tax=Chitinophaga sp. HK235 TaxID=2952571 RepID=UPI001BA629AE|nr:hypothetical protein [Chitinophaga sp. HK235]
MSQQDWPATAIQGIRSQTLFIFGDADAVQLEHAVEMLRLRGGGKMGDMAPLPNMRLAVLPGTTHTGVVFKQQWLIPMMEDFLSSNAIVSGF